MWVFEFFRFLKEWWFIIVIVGGGIFSFLKGIDSINSNLKDILYQLKTFNEKIILSERDREKIHLELEKHDDILSSHKSLLDKHDERLKTLLNDRKEGK